MILYIHSQLGFHSSAGKWARRNIRMGNWDLENFARYPTARLLGSGSIRGCYLEVRVKALTGSNGISLG